MGGIEQREGNKKILKRGGRQAGSRGGCIKKGGWNPLTNYGYAVWFYARVWYNRFSETYIVAGNFLEKK